MDAVINAHGLQVAYGKHVALNLEDFRMDSQAGVVGLFGPNGAGKTTLLRTLVGDIAKFKGSLQAPNRTDISYLPDEPFLYPWLSDYLLELIRTLRSPKAPLLLSTHLINGVDSIFNEIVLISDGRLLTHDSADNLRALGDGDLELAYKRSVSGR